MVSLIFGLIAALSWGLHDFLVRDLSQKSPATPLLFMVLLAGCAILAPTSLILGDWGRMGLPTTLTALTAGLCYAAGCYGLYRAFAIGPVRLVAPICGAFPVLSVAWAAVSGQTILLGQWLAVFAVVGGVALVARQSGHEHGHPETTTNRSQAILWAVLGATGFALTFALGQIAARTGSELPAMLVARIGALLAVGLTLIGARISLAPALPHLRLLALMGLLDATSLGLVIAAGGLPHPEYAAVASSIFGLVTILLAWHFLHEKMRPLQWAGVGIVFAAVAWLAAT